MMFQHLTTLEIRETACRRHALDRKIEKIQTSFGEVRVKISGGYHVKREKIEFEDLTRIANEKHHLSKKSEKRFCLKETTKNIRLITICVVNLFLLRVLTVLTLSLHKSNKP